MSGQNARILAHFRAHPNEDIPAVELQRIGSGKSTGWCASFTRRIADCRELGNDIRLTRDEVINGQRRTWYRYVPPGATYTPPPSPQMELL